MSTTPATPTIVTVHGMQVHVRVNNTAEFADLLRRTDGEYPVSGDLTRLRFPLWPQFTSPSVWDSVGVGKRRNPAAAR